MKLKREVKIGLFALAMLLCLYLGINYLKGKEVFRGDKAYYTLFEQTNGLQKSSPVLLRGVKIGSVTDISIDPKKPDQVVVTVNIKRSIRIPEDSRLKLFSEGIMGSKAIELIPGDSDVFLEKHSVIRSETESGFLDSASLSISDILADVKNVVNSLEATSNSLNDILAQNAEGFKGTVNNLRSVTGQLAAGDLRKMLGDLNDFTSMLRNNSPRFDNIIGNLDGIADSLGKTDIKATIDTLGMGIAELNAILGKLSAGEGTAGRLLGDDALYDSLVATVNELSQLVTDIREHPKRYINISIFGGGREKKDK